jgi:hypothetical protein
MATPTRTVFRIGMTVYIKGGKYEDLYATINAITTEKIDVTIFDRRHRTIVQTMISQHNAEPFNPPAPPPPIVAPPYGVPIQIILHVVEELLSCGLNNTLARQPSDEITEEEWEAICHRMSRLFIEGERFNP